MCKITFNKNRDKLNKILKEFSSGLKLQSYHFDLVQKLIEVRCDLEKPNFEVFLTPNSTKFMWVKQVYIYMVYHYKEPELLKRDLELLCFLFDLGLKDKTKISLEVKFAPIHSKYTNEDQLQLGLAQDFLFDKTMPLDMLYICCAMILFGNLIPLKGLNEGQLEFLYHDGKDIVKKLFPNDLLKEGQWQDLFGKVEVCGDQVQPLQQSVENREDDIKKRLRIVNGKLEKIDSGTHLDEPKDVVVVEKVEALKEPKVVESENKSLKNIDVYLDLDKSKSTTISTGMFLVFSLVGFLMGSLMIGVIGGIVSATILYPLYMEKVSLSFQTDKVDLKIDDDIISILYKDILRIEKKQGDKLQIFFRDTSLRPIQIFESNESYKKLVNRVNESILSNCLVEVTG
ncbi:MAG: hypothetical protein KC646_13230 [Candidatus Cloacimonetes bacterium]|nr:hypothetical protein [Candidatus Cloacimonadota bacterium]